MDEALPRVLVRLAPNTITDRAALNRELATVRQRGWAEDREESTEGITLPGRRRPIRIAAQYAISCSLPTIRLTEDLRNHILDALLRPRELKARWRASAVGSSPALRRP